MLGCMRAHLVVTDLDGTLLDSNRRLGEDDRETLLGLGERGAIRVVATGRSLFSACQVLGPDVPIDFLVHSSGAGIVAWPDLRPVRVQHMAASLASILVRELVARELDFMLHRAIPNNHQFLAFRRDRQNADFERRLRRYANHARPLRLPWPPTEPMCQAIVICPPGTPAMDVELERALPEFRIIRTTSPLDGASTWVEIFPGGVGKAAASAWLWDHTPSAPMGTSCPRSVAIGNDYNDLDLLDWADAPFVVGNAPDELRRRYTTVASNDGAGFSEAIRRAELMS